MALSLAARIQLLRFLVAVVFFHGSEYFLAVAIHGRSRVSLGSLLISKQYAFAMICALLEYKIELVFFPELKENWWMSNIGLVMVIIGEIIRKAAILTARRAFTHTIRVYHENHHQLITHGIYRDIPDLEKIIISCTIKELCKIQQFRFMRHPGYCGFFIWATGTQLMLCNPICIVAFTMVTWRFFYRRIRNRFEEFFLRQFFRSRYVEYARQVPSGLPFIK